MYWYNWYNRIVDCSIENYWKNTLPAIFHSMGQFELNNLWRRADDKTSIISDLSLFYMFVVILHGYTKGLEFALWHFHLLLLWILLWAGQLLIKAGGTVIWAEDKGRFKDDGKWNALPIKATQLDLSIFKSGTQINYR